MSYPAMRPDADGDREDGAVRLWISERQWMAILQDTERQGPSTPDAADGPVENQRQSPRLPAPEDARCMIKLGDRTQDHGTYLVRLRDISRSGLGFFSAHAFASKTPCTVALQDGEGHGMVSSARVVWCRPIDGGLHDVGIRFDQPIDPSRFIDDTPELPDVPC